MASTTEPDVVTHYMSPFRLTALVDKDAPDPSRHGHAGALHIGGSGDWNGLALFVSALDAEMFRQRHVAVCGDHMRLCPLASFDLLELARQQRGRVSCSIAFGFSAAPGAGLRCGTGGDLSTLSVDTGFNVGRDVPLPATFQFPHATTDFIESEWECLGGKGHGDAVEKINQGPFDELQDMAAHALAQVQLSKHRPSSGHWAFWDAADGRWRFGLTQEAWRKRLKLVPSRKR